MKLLREISARSHFTNFEHFKFAPIPLNRSIRICYGTTDNHTFGK